MFRKLLQWCRKAAPHLDADYANSTIAEQVQRWERTHPGGTWPELPQTGLLGRIHAVEEAAATNPGLDSTQRKRR